MSILYILNKNKAANNLEQDNVSDYIEVDEPTKDNIETVPKVSLNPLPPERLILRTSEEREKSSEPGHDEVGNLLLIFKAA